MEILEAEKILKSYTEDNICIEFNDLRKAIETVLNRVKELEEENKQLTDSYMIQKHLINAEFLSNYVGKDRIKEYINSLSNKLKEYKTNLGGKEYIDMSYLDKKEKELVNNIIVQIATLKDLL